MKRIIFYNDELNDDFAGVQKKKIKIPHDFKFVHKSIFWRFFAFIAYRIIMTPFAYLYCKIKFNLKIVDRTDLPLEKNDGCFLYSNHTLLAGDAFIPSILAYPKKVYVVVSPENISSTGTKNFLLMNGAIPLPQSATAFKGFVHAIEQRITQGHCVTIYPEAHIWPYYTKIRPYPAKSFRFSVKNNAPIYVSTTTFQKKLFGKTPRVTVFLEGPFYPNTAVTPREAEQQLRDTAYKVMCRNAKNNTYCPIKYVRREQEFNDIDNVRRKSQHV